MANNKAHDATVWRRGIDGLREQVLNSTLFCMPILTYRKAFSNENRIWIKNNKLER